MERKLTYTQRKDKRSASIIRRRSEQPRQSLTHPLSLQSSFTLVFQHYFLPRFGKLETRHIR